MATRSLVTNQKVAEDLKITHSAVSRIRSGDRRPSLEVMLRIMDLYGWSLEVQALSWSLGLYPKDFESTLMKHYEQ